MKLLITGATGFVGRNFLLQALRSGKYETIYVIVRSVAKLRTQLQGDGFDSIPPSLIVIEGDARDWKFNPSYLIEHVVHCAANLFGQNEEEFFETNVIGTLRLLEKVPYSNRVVILSSQAAAGPCHKGQLFRLESDEDSPLTFYGKSKLIMEEEVKKQFPQLPCVFIRPAWIMGPRDLAFFPLISLSLLPIQFKPGIKEKRYSFIDIEDLVEAILSVLQYANDFSLVQNQPFFVSSSNTFTDVELFSLLANLMGKKKKPWIIPIPSRSIEIFSKIVEYFPSFSMQIPSLTRDRVKEIIPDRWVVSSKKFETVFQWKARQPLSTTIRNSLEWYIRCGKLRRNINATSIAPTAYPV